MGQSESKDSLNNSNDILDRKQIIGKEDRSNALNDHNIDIDRDLENKSNDENNKKMSENEEKIKKSKTYDFACNSFKIF